MAGTPIAVTGAGGRTGSALVAALRAGGIEVVEWVRPDYDLDDPAVAARVIARDKPARVFHAAAWTDVDACARNPDLAMRRNGAATAELAAACAATGTDLVYISTNEVFSGERTDGRGYGEDDEVGPQNPYARSKLRGETAVREAFDGAFSRAWIVRTSWLFGHPGEDFPRRIVAAADPVTDHPLAVVADEIGRPTYASDLVAALIQLTTAAPAGTYHLANEGPASRFEWAQAILARCRPEVTLEAISQVDFKRDSVPPRWGVLDTSLAASHGVRLRPWQEPLAGYLDEICPRR